MGNLINPETTQIARKNYWSFDIDQAFSYYIEAFDSSPKAWWLVMEAIRCKRYLQNCKQKENIIISYPTYVGNPYQQNLYSESKHFKYKIFPITDLQIDERLVVATFSKRLVFHQHWLKDIYWDMLSLEVGTFAIERHIGILRALKSYGAKICWTLHNLIDHDANPLQEKLNNLALRQMAEVSDHIFIHNKGAGDLLSAHCNMDFSGKFIVIEHPLYDNLLNLQLFSRPKEIHDEHIAGRRILVCLGMVRPYKGVPDLIRAFQQIVNRDKSHGLHLIIAGHLLDREVTEVLGVLDEATRSCISVVARRLTEEEVGGLMRLAHVSITPYKKVLTSGSYFLATTFEVPTVAPRKGMFIDIIKDKVTGFLYDGSVDELVKLLFQITQCSPVDLARVGKSAREEAKHLNIHAVSTRFFMQLETLK